MGMKSGGVGAQLSTPSITRALPHDIIQFSPKTKECTYDVCAPLYEAGWALREIVAKTGFARTTIRAALVERGLIQQGPPKKPGGRKTSASSRRGILPPYGQAWLEGKLVVDPREHKTIQLILKLRRSGKSFTAIAKHLNDQRVPTRMGRKWHSFSVSRIVHQQSQPTR